MKEYKYIENTITYFALEHDYMRFVLYQPSIEPFHILKFDNIDDSLYFYYKAKIEIFDIENEVWNTIKSGDIYDFPAIQTVIPKIDYIRNYDLENDVGKRIYFVEKDKTSKTDFESLFVLEDNFPMIEDIYNFTKHFIFIKDNYNPETDSFEDTKTTYYDIYIGIGNFGSSSIGLSVNRLTCDELDIVKSFANHFIEYAETITKDGIEKYLNDIENNRIENDDEFAFDIKVIYNHLKEKYPEDIDKWKNIVVNISKYDDIFDEYVKYIKDGMYSDKNKDYEVFLERIKKIDEN